MSREISVSLSHFLVRPRLVRFIVYLVKDGARLGLFNIGSERHGMYGIGIPEDLQYFETLPLARKACALEMP